MLLHKTVKRSHDYIIVETLEAGIVLQGTEIKSIRNSRINLKDGFVRIRNGEAFLSNVHISPYEQGNIFNHDPLRTRKLLLHKKQIHKMGNGKQKRRNDHCPFASLFKRWLCESSNWLGKREERL